MFISLAAFCPEAAIASLLARHIITGRPTLRVDFTAMVTGVSVIPRASFESVLPVQGQTIIASAKCFGPMGSASTMVWSTRRPASSSARSIKSEALPKRVSVPYTFWDITGSSSYLSRSPAICSSALSRVQKEPHMAKPSVCN